MAHMLKVGSVQTKKWENPLVFKSRRERDRNEVLYSEAGYDTHAWTETKAEERDRLQRRGEDALSRGEAHL